MNHVLVSVAIVLFGINILASIGVARDQELNPVQRWMQTLLVWLVPLVGSLATFLVRRSHREAQLPACPQESIGTNKYEEARDMLSAESMDADDASNFSGHL